MSYYSELLSTAFDVLADSRAPQILALLPDTGGIQHEVNNNDSRFVFPEILLPQAARSLELSGGEFFIQDALQVVRSNKSECVFAFPPLIGDSRLSADWKNQNGRLGIAEALADCLIGDGLAIKDTGTGSFNVAALAMLVPTHFLTSSRSGKWRREFFAAHSAVIIEHGNILDGVGNPNVIFQLATVIFQRRSGPVRFFKIPPSANTQFLEDLAKDLRRLLLQPAGKSKYGYVYQGVIKEDYPCSYDFYSEETAKLRAQISELGEKVSLGSVADVLLGLRPCRPERKNGQGSTGYYCLKGRDISTDGSVYLSEVEEQQRPAEILNYLQDGDLCIRQVYRPDSGFIVGRYESDGRPITYDNTVIVVRPRATLTTAQRQVLLSFLRSPLSHRLGNAKQLLPSLGEYSRVTAQVLREFPVPLADEELTSSIQQLSEARQEFVRWIEEIDQDSNAIMLESTASGSRRRLLHAGQLARQRHRAGQQVEELDYRIRTQFPHPLAYIWRELQVSGTDPYHRLRAVLKAAEGNTCFIALIAILISQSLGQQISYVNGMANRLVKEKKGTNFGDWFAIIKELNDCRAFRQAQSKSPFAEVLELCLSQKWETSVRSLMTLRNDDSHGRIAPTSVSKETLDGAESALEVLYQSTEFLTDYQLIQITETRFDSIQKINRIQYRDFTGDNTLAPLRQDEVQRSDLEAGSVYLRDRQNHLHLFRPLLHYLECPECHLMSMFFLDKFDGANGGSYVQLKSFERNTVRTEPAADDFRHIGLLK
jgi:hypothetical protein